jgi:hypothetical protein
MQVPVLSAASRSCEPHMVSGLNTPHNDWRGTTPSMPRQPAGYSSKLFCSSATEPAGSFSDRTVCNHTTAAVARATHDRALLALGANSGPLPHKEACFTVCQQWNIPHSAATWSTTCRLLKQAAAYRKQETLLATRSPHRIRLVGNMYRQHRPWS